MTDRLEMDEYQYTAEIVMPLLQQLGYEEVTYNHGVEEFGKDVVFAEHDRFGNKVYHAAQVKAGNLSAGDSSRVNDVIAHIVRAFDVTFRDLITKSPVRISHFFVFVQGRFTRDSTQRLLKSEDLVRYMHRLHFYGGEHTEQLKTRAFRQVRALLEAQFVEIEWNRELSSSVALAQPVSLLLAYRTRNVARLIDALSAVDRFADLIRQLRLYEARLLRQNGLITALPMMRILDGGTTAVEFLKSESKSVGQLADQVSALVRTAIGQVGP